MSRPATGQTRRDGIAQARALTTDDAIVRVAVRQLRVRVEPVRGGRKHVGQLDAAIATALAAHPAAAWFRDLPGADAGLAPRGLRAFNWVRLLWKCGPDRAPYDEARHLKPRARRRSPLTKALAQTPPANS